MANFVLNFSHFRYHHGNGNVKNAYRVCLVNENEAVKRRDLESPLLAITLIQATMYSTLCIKIPTFLSL